MSLCGVSEPRRYRWYVLGAGRSLEKPRLEKLGDFITVCCPPHPPRVPRSPPDRACLVTPCPNANCPRNMRHPGGSLLGQP